ncbi:hypothetical protein LTR72_006293 [Exophiala xenobiotica]|nr:hypothetical protein LTR72_006293 [Exophiala xenobiotica]KAK5295072.1 hypothetical protein LTR14_004242 [Exophiala xenobiotica]KAK5482884.1 hypothetical protein LTR55_006282 [Exophiala xenobiotica]
MVGVPHSKACINCRARRKGCDAVRPCCGQCLRRGVICKGYVKALNIIWEHPGRKKSSSPTTALEEAVARKTVGHYGRNSFPLRGLPPSCLDTAARVQIYGRFFDIYLPHTSAQWPKLNSDIEILPETSWLRAGASVAATVPVLNDALTALSLAHIASSSDQKEMLHASQALYVGAVGGVNKLLKDKTAVMEDTTLATVMALGLYEMQAGVSVRSKSWLSHVNGASALIHLRGASNFSTELSHRLFFGTRLTEKLINGVGNRQRCDNAALWSVLRSTPLKPEMDSAHARLFEVLETLPDILGLWDRIKTTPEPEGDLLLEMVTEFVQQCQEFEARLTDWLSGLEFVYGWDDPHQDFSPSHASTAPENGDEPSSALYWFEPSTLYEQLLPTDSARIFPYFICFRDPNIAEQITLYWTGLLLVHISLHGARERCCRAGLSLAAIPQMGRTNPQQSAQTLAIHIAQSLEYFLHPDMGLLGTNFVGFPLAVAQGYFQSCGAKEALWFDVIFIRMREMRSGLAVFLEDMYKGQTLTLVRR